jgi:hypothetical protein
MHLPLNRPYQGCGYCSEAIQPEFSDAVLPERIRPLPAAQALKLILKFISKMPIYPEKLSVDYPFGCAYRLFLSTILRISIPLAQCVH